MENLHIMWKLNSLLNNHWVKGEIKKCPENMKTEVQHNKNNGYSKSSSSREVHNDKYLSQETRKNLKQPYSIPQGIRKTNEDQSW